MVDPHPSTSYDVVVLGGGSAGYACAFRARELGLNVALVEKDVLGGTCLHHGCIPTKALLHAAEVADTVRDAGTFGVRCTLEDIDMTAVRAYQDRVVSRLYKGLQGLARARELTIVAGTARLRGPNSVEVTGTDGTSQTLQGSHLVLATGARPAGLAGLKPDGRRVLTSHEALRLERTPSSAVVVGGGFIGSEFASAWRSLGAEVTIVEALDRLVVGEDEACSAALRRAFTNRGITVRTESSVTAVESDNDVSITLADGEQVTTEVVLVATGRVPVTDDLGLEEVGIRLDERGFVQTDARLMTSVPTVTAAGDLVAGPQLAHRGFGHGIFLAEQIAGRQPTPVLDTTVPRVTYSDPQIAAVGRTEAEAVAELGDEAVETVHYDLAGNGKSQILGTSGFVKVVRSKDGPVLGVHMVGARVGELISEAQLITGWEAWPEEVAPLVHAHPTQSEALGEAHLALAGKPLHAPG